MQGYSYKISDIWEISQFSRLDSYQNILYYQTNLVSYLLIKDNIPPKERTSKKMVAVTLSLEVDICYIISLSAKESLILTMHRVSRITSKPSMQIQRKMSHGIVFSFNLLLQQSPVISNSPGKQKMVRDNRS